MSGFGLCGDEVLCPTCDEIMDWLPIPDELQGDFFCPYCDENHPQYSKEDELT